MSIPGLFFGSEPQTPQTSTLPERAGITPCLPCAPAHSCYRTKENVQYYMRRTKTSDTDIEVKVTRNVTVCENTAPPRLACADELEALKKIHFL